MKNIFVIIFVAALLIMTVICSTNISSALAEPKNDIEKFELSTNVSYSTIYYHGNTFVVFCNGSGSDIEVIKIQ